MTTDSKAAVPAHPSATVLLLRDGPAGLEVFMVVRHQDIAFASGALVFPGGRVDPGDEVLAAALPPAEQGPSGATRLAAIRETFEECGVLLARPRGEAALLDADRLLAVSEVHRNALCRGERSFAEILTAEGLEPAAECLVPFAHWVTPPHRPKRFDTHFFLVAAPPGQLALHDGGESVDSIWIRPQDALAEAEDGRRKLVFATRMNLTKLARFPTVAAALEAAQASPVVTVMPQPLRTPDGPAMRIPIEAGYGGDLFPANDPPAI